MTSLMSVPSLIFSTVILLVIVLAISTKKDIFLFLIATILLSNKYFFSTNYFLECILFVFVSFYLLYLISKNYKRELKLYANRDISYLIQLLSILLLSMIQIDIQLHVMLLFGYFMLFRQERWHKHLYIMFLMILIIFITTGGLDLILGLLENFQ